MREVEGTKLGADEKGIELEIETSGRGFLAILGTQKERLRLHPALARQLADDLLVAVVQHERARGAR